MEAHFVLWEAAGTAEDLEIAQGLLARLREQAPVADRGTMVDNVDLHRRIAEAQTGEDDADTDERDIASEVTDPKLAETIRRELEKQRRQKRRKPESGDD